MALLVNEFRKYPVAFLNKALAYYNQDVDVNNRAIGRLHSVDSHVLWNLNYLKVEEKNNKDLKQLLDNLRVYGLLPYYLNNDARTLAKNELAKVDWENQPPKVVKQYSTPILLLKLRMCFLKFASMLKAKIKYQSQSYLNNLKSI